MHSQRCARRACYRTVRRSWPAVQTSPLPPTAHLPVPVHWAVDGSPDRTRTATCRRSRTGTSRATATQSLKSPPTIAAAAAAWLDASAHLCRPSYLSFPYVNATYIVLIIEYRLRGRGYLTNTFPNCKTTLYSFSQRHGALILVSNTQHAYINQSINHY